MPCLVCGGTYPESPLPGLLAFQTCEFITENIEISDDALRQLYTAKYFAGRE